MREVLSRLASLLGFRGVDSRLHILFFFGRWQHRFHSERLQPELATPAAAVIEVFVFLVLDLAVSLLQRLCLFPFQCLRALADQLPIGMILGLRENDTFAGNE